MNPAPVLTGGDSPAVRNTCTASGPDTQKRAFVSNSSGVVWQIVRRLLPLMLHAAEGRKPNVIVIHSGEVPIR